MKRYLILCLTCLLFCFNNILIAGTPAESSVSPHEIIQNIQTGWDEQMELTLPLPLNCKLSITGWAYMEGVGQFKVTLTATNDDCEEAAKELRGLVIEYQLRISLK